ncbi:MAG TPA: aldose 1-epimerase family protein [Cryptosporangiaceae bacterium]|nr:aldose 1-epimerase family protein [Cryptosporangiaceae bacterium]
MAARWRNPSGHQWFISAGPHQATIVEVGGGVREYTCAGEPVLDGYAEDAMCRGAAGQVLAPWPNRICDGRYVWDGTEHQLPIEDVDRHHALHGLVRWEIWDRVDHTPDSVTAARAIQPRPGYPYAIALSTRWSVSPAGGLRADHVATNVGPSPAPFGLGAHPYVMLPGPPGDVPVLRVPAGRRLVADDRLMPTGQEPVDGTDFDFREPRPVGESGWDTTFAVTERDADGLSRTTLTDRDGCGTEVWQDDSFGWIQLYDGGSRPRAGRSLGIVPMTCPPDAFRSGTDVLALGPGQRWWGSWGIRPLRPR